MERGKKMFSALRSKGSKNRLMFSVKKSGTPAFRPHLETFEDRLLLSTYLVTNTDDAGAGSLRQAILDTNSHGGQNTIAFNIPGDGVHTIQPDSPLPFITNSVLIDGTTQNGYSGAPLIELDGSHAGPNAAGLNFVQANADNSTVKGLAVNDFSVAGVLISGGTGIQVSGNYIGTDATGTIAKSNGIGVDVHGSSNSIGGTTPETRNIISGNNIGVSVGSGAYNQIQGNYIGTDVTGTVALGNNTGVSLISTFGNTMGGLVSGAGNLISGNQGDGLLISGAGGGNLVVGNLIGTDATGTVALGNLNGIEMHPGPTSNGGTIGGVQPEAANVISGNQQEGILISGNGRLTTGFRVIGNWIGTDATGSINLGNGGDGVALVNVWASSVGGTAPNSGNVIGYNGGDGIRIDNAIYNAIQGNVIFASANLGIELVNGGNHDQAFPDISYATTDDSSTTIAGTLNSSPSSDFTLEFFASYTCNPSGYGEAEQLLGTSPVHTNSQGSIDFNVSFNSPVDPSQFITATATTSLGDTSQFSACLAVSPPGAPGSSRHHTEGTKGTMGDLASLFLDQKFQLPRWFESADPGLQPIPTNFSKDYAQADLDRYFTNLDRKFPEDWTRSILSQRNGDQQLDVDPAKDIFFSLEKDLAGSQ
jgi:hypothetical protein